MIFVYKMYFSDSPAPLFLQASTKNCVVVALDGQWGNFWIFFGSKTDMVKAFLYIRAQDGESTNRYFR